MIAAAPRLGEAASLERFSDSLFGYGRRMDRVVHEPNPVVVVEVVIRVVRIEPNGSYWCV